MSGTKEAPSGPLLGVGPVLEASACRIAEPFAVDAVAEDSVLTVTVVGYDSGRVARVSGAATAPGLGAEPLHVKLAGRSGVTPDVLVINRTAVLNGTALADVATMVIATSRMPTDILTVNADQARGYFSGVEPGAFGIDGLPDTDLTAIFTVTRGNAPQRARLTATQKGTYWQADPN